jgi:uncharacterized protein YoxC
MELQSFLIILSVILVVLLLFLVLLILRIMKMLQSVTDLVKTTEESIKPMMSEATETVKKANMIVGTVEGTLGNVRTLTDSFVEIGDGIRRVVVSLRETEVVLSNVKGQVAGASAAVRATVRTLAKGLFRKEEDRQGEKKGPDN